MTHPPIEEVITALPKILKQPIETNGGQYAIRFYQDWVIKKPLNQPPLANGRILKAVNPLKTIEQYEKIASMEIEWLNIPKIMYIKRYDVIIQQRIIGITLKKLDNPDLFLYLKAHFKRVQRLHHFNEKDGVLQPRNVIIDETGKLWLIDPD